MKLTIAVLAAVILKSGGESSSDEFREELTGVEQVIEESSV
jgi:hypothetical protein